MERLHQENHKREEKRKCSFSLFLRAFVFRREPNRASLMRAGWKEANERRMSTHGAAQSREKQ